MSIETAQFFIQTGMLQELAKIAGAEIGKASVVADRNGHVWQSVSNVVSRDFWRVCARCGRIEHYDYGIRVDDGAQVYGWLVHHDGDGYCAELLGGAR